GPNGQGLFCSHNVSTLFDEQKTYDVPALKNGNLKPMAGTCYSPALHRRMLQDDSVTLSPGPLSSRAAELYRL
ncbi:MAG: hypothetical protein ACXW34_07500, partial [Nitrospira sp.]